LSITEYCKNKNKEYNEGIGGNSMKLGVKICKYLVILLGTFIIVMSLDSFDGTDTFWGMLLEFIMNSIPGIILIGLIILLWKQELILSIFFLFRFYRNNFENWLTMLTVEIPLLAAGTMFILKHLKDKELDH
jgi:hypothetical protein